MEKFYLIDNWHPVKNVNYRLPEDGLIVSVRQSGKTFSVDPPIPVKAGEPLKLERLEDGSFRKVEP